MSLLQESGEAAKGPIGSTTAFNGDPNARSDTFDILHYDITIDLSEASTNTLIGTTGLTFVSKMDGLTGITLDLEGLTVSTVYNDTANLNYSHPGTRFFIG
ncbi:MAG: hypothetical protein R2769_12825 [Saprospiraceae bacterium]